MTEKDTRSGDFEMEQSPFIKDDDRPIPDIKVNGVTVTDGPVFDDIFEYLGKLGFYQMMVFVMSNLIELSATISVMYFIFECANPGWSCEAVECVRTANTSSCSGISLPNSTQGLCSSRDLGLYCVNRTFDPMYTSVLTEWDLVCDKLWQSKALSSIFFVALIPGAVIGSQVSDSFGRRPTIFIMWFGQILFQLVLRFSPNYIVYCVLRFITGVFTGAMVCVVPILSLEWISPKWRTIASVRFSWQAAPAVMALLAYIFRDWQTLTTAVGLVTAPLFPICLFLLPESPRWLVQKRRFKEAEYWINKAAWFNRKGSHKNLRKFLEDVANAEDENEHKRSRRYTYLDLIHNKDMTIWTIIIAFSMFVLAADWYGISSAMSSLSGNIYLNVGVSGIGTLFFGVFAVYIMNWLGRIKGYVLYITLTGSCHVAILIMEWTGYATNNKMVVTYFALASCAIMAGGWSSIGMSCWELYPTLMRNIATGSASIGLRIGSILAPHIMFLGTIHGTIPYIIFAVLSFTSAVLVFIFLPETKGKPLPDN